MRDTRLKPTEASHVLPVVNCLTTKPTPSKDASKFKAVQSGDLKTARPPLYRRAIAPLQPFSYCSVLLASINNRTHSDSSSRDEWNWPAALHWAPTRI